MLGHVSFADSSKDVSSHSFRLHKFLVSSPSVLHVQMRQFLCLGL